MRALLRPLLPSFISRETSAALLIHRTSPPGDTGLVAGVALITSVMLLFCFLL
jgi:hypothetical protein